MNVHPLGRVNVTTSGTPVSLPAGSATRVFFQVIPGLSGKMYIGTPQMNIATLDGVIRILWPNHDGGPSETFEVLSQTDEDSIHLPAYAIDAQIGGEGLLVTWWEA